MFRIRKLYTEPEVIDPVEFFDGVNIILGVKDESSDKTNGVGKSLSMEFLNFALLADKNRSRVSFIPSEAFPPDTDICLDIELAGKNYTIKRSIENSEEPKLLSDGDMTVFSNIEDASTFIREKLFSHTGSKTPSFRAMLGPLMRDERSEFKSIVGCYDTNFRIPDNYAPHLFLFGLGIEGYVSIRAAINEIDDLNDRHWEDKRKCKATAAKGHF